jgi:hypothetical protein
VIFILLLSGTKLIRSTCSTMNVIARSIHLRCLNVFRAYGLKSKSYKSTIHYRKEIIIKMIIIFSHFYGCCCVCTMYIVQSSNYDWAIDQQQQFIVRVVRGRKITLFFFHVKCFFFYLVDEKRVRIRPA